MLRVTLVLLVTLVGLGLNFFDPFYGLLLYTWYSYAYPLELTYGMLEGTRLSFVVACFFLLSAVLYYRRLCIINFLTLIVILFLIHAFSSLAVKGSYNISYILSATEFLNKNALIALVSPVVLISTAKLKGYNAAIVFIVGFLAFYYGFFGLLAGSRSISGAGKIGDNNFYASLLITVIPLSLGFFYSYRNIFIKAVAVVITFGLFLATLLTFSRGGMIGLLVITVLLVLKIRKKILVPLLLLVFLSYYYIDKNNLFPDLHEYSFQRDFQESDAVSETVDMFSARMMTLLDNPQETESAESRIHFWKVAWEMAKENPIWGVGINRFRDNYKSYDFSDGAYGPARSVHSSYFLVMSETGLIGLLLYMLIIATCFVYYIKSLKRLRLIKENQDLYKLISFFPIAMIGYMVCSIFIITIYIEIFWSLVALAISSDFISKELVAQNEDTSDQS